MNISFEEFGLQDETLEAIQSLGYTQPTPIQVETIPQMMEGRDVIAQSQTGTGKTAAFMLPILQKIDQNNRNVQALVLAPTRELAKQVADAGQGFSRSKQVGILAVYGGQSYEIQLKGLKRGAQIVVGTPGRLLDLIRQGRLDLGHVSIVVLDEADEMLEMGFIDDVDLILNELAEERQIALFSATLPEPIKVLARRYLKDPARISINPRRLTVDETEQRFYRVNEEGKLGALTALLETDGVTTALIFARTKARAQDLADELLRRGFSADSLHGDLNQARREMVLNRFRQGTVSLLVATDVAARGLDIQDVSHVFNYDMPADAEDYVHRIGRTGRAGKKGIAATLLTPRERSRMNQIQAFTRQPAKECNLPSAVDIQKMRDEKLIGKISDQLIAGVSSNERTLIDQMRGNGFTTEELAVGLLRLLRSNENKISVKELLKPEKLENRKTDTANQHNRGDRKQEYFADDATPGNTATEEGMVRLWMNLGNRNGLRPGDIVGAIAGEAGIPGKAIGEINIKSSYTLVDVSEKHVGNVLKASKKSYRIKGKPVLLRLADEQARF